MFKQLVLKEPLRYACPDCAPGLTKLQIDRYNSRVKPVRVRPRKHAKDYTQTPTYQHSEAAIFNFIAQVAPAGTRDGENDAYAAAWAAIYMADIIAQERRPMHWDRTARTVLGSCLSYLLTLQHPSAAATDPRHGGFVANGTFAAGEQMPTSLAIAAGIAFTKAYAAVGDTRYLHAAQMAGTFIRHMQCGDLRTVGFTVSPGTSTPYHLNGLAEYVIDDDDRMFSANYYTRDIAALWFLKLLADEVGDDTEYGETSSAQFSASTVASIATMIEELSSFATDGVRVSGQADLVSGYNASAPRLKHTAATDGGSSSAEWEHPDDGIDVRDLALATAGLHYAEEGEDEVAAMMTMLAASPASEVHETPAGNTAEETYADMTGTYNAALCPATVLHESDPFVNESFLYDWASLGLLAPIRAEDQATFRTSKDTLSAARRHTTLEVTAKYIGPDGLSGLSLQPIRPDTDGQYDNAVVRAARTGLIYRQAPGRYQSLRGV